MLTMEEFFKTLSQMYLGQMRRENFDNVSSSKGIYQYVVNSINQEMQKDPTNRLYYDKMRNVLDRFFELITDPKALEEIKDKKITIAQFMNLYRDIVLGSDNRKYNMSDLFNEKYIASRVNTKTGEEDKKIAYRKLESKPFKYKDSMGQEGEIQLVGSLGMENYNREKDYLFKYRVQRKISDKNYIVNEIYSNIRIADMDDPEYLEAVCMELLNDSNIMLSNADGYIGQIDNTPVEMKQDKIGTEKTIADVYYYKINDKYSLAYDATYVTAVMLYEKAQKAKQDIKENKNLIDMVRDFNQDDYGEELEDNEPDLG